MIRTINQPDYPKTAEDWRDWWNNFFEDIPFKHSGGELVINAYKDPDEEEKAISDMSIEAAKVAAVEHNLTIVIKYEVKSSAKDKST